jgi:hypothetical protein
LPASPFLITGASIGVVGTLVGVVVGTLICLNIESIRRLLSWMTSTELFPSDLYFLSKLPAEMDTGETFAVVAMALTLSFLATLYPSWRAKTMDSSGAMAPREGDCMSRETCATPSTVVARESGRSSTPRPIGSCAACSGILGRPVGSGDDGGNWRGAFADTTTA